MISLDVSADISRGKRKLYRMRDREVARAGAVALNRTITTVRAAATKEMKQAVGAELGLGASGVKKAIKMYRASFKHLVAKLVASGKHMPLINFRARQTKTGVTHSAWGKRQIAKGAFIARMPGGHKGVYRRVDSRYAKRHTKGRPATSSPNLPIKEMWGPSLPREFVSTRVLARMRLTARKVWPKNFQHELNRRLSRMK